jgi:cobalt-zinc-cadmium efflux system outer membrane protein
MGFEKLRGLQIIGFKLILLSTLSSLVVSCGFQSYTPKPINSHIAKNLFEQKSPQSDDFYAYLISQGYQSKSLPIAYWGITELTYSALFFHPELDLARSEWRAAQSAEITASQRIDPNISVNSGKNTINDPEANPWTYSLGIDIGIITAGKREARIDRALGLSEAAKIKIAQTAWQVRTRLARSLIEYEYSLKLSQILQKEVDLRTSIVDMLQKRVDAGIASSTDLNQARIALQKAEQSLTTEKIRTPGLLAALSSDAGLPLKTFEGLALALNALESQPEEILPFDDLQEVAMLNRLDLRASIARYAAAEAKLRLEIGKQYPDLIISPSYSYEPDGKFWSLGLGSIMTLLNKNKGLIAEANALRDVEAAQFNVTQAKVISELNQSKVTYIESFNALKLAKKLLITQATRLQQIEQQFSAGIADRLLLTQTTLENTIASQNDLLVRYQFLKSKITLEDALQKPLTDPISIEQASRQH